MDGSINNEVQTVIGDNIRRVRLERGISQRDLAAWCNFESSNLSRIEGGRTNLTVGNLVKIARALEVDVTELLRGV